MRYLSIALLLALPFVAAAQKNEKAKALFELAKQDTTAHQDSLASIHFLQAAEEELKETATEPNFIGRMYLYAARSLVKAGNYTRAHEYFLKAIKEGHTAPNKNIVYRALTEVGQLYDLAASTVFDFPKSNDQETIEANFSVLTKPERMPNGKMVITIAAGSNDGLYVGAEGKVWAKNTKAFRDRSGTNLGKIKIIRVEANVSVGEVEITKPGDPYFDIYPLDLAYVPIRFPRIALKNILLDVSLLHIQFMNNDVKWLAHPRTLLYYFSPEVEEDVYNYMIREMVDVAQLFKNDTVFNKPPSKGRFRGTKLMDALLLTSKNDLQAFLDFIRTYSVSYMGESWRMSEVYATWVLNGAPPGASASLDSLIKYSNDDKAFDTFLESIKKDVSDAFFERWIVDAQERGNNKEFASAYQRNDVIQKVCSRLHNDSLLAWAYFNRGVILSVDKQDSLSIEYYKKAKPLFHKAGDAKGESYCINNIGSKLQGMYKYKESQPYFEEALQLRLQMLSRDTSDNTKLEVARAYGGIAYAVYKQDKYNESNEIYFKAVELIKNVPALAARKHLAALYSSIGKSFEKMGKYKEAAGYYDQEYEVQRLLGDDEAMADALDNSAHLLSLLGRSRDAFNGYSRAYVLHLKSKNTNDAGFSMSNMGQTLWTLGKFDSAIQAHMAAIALREKANNVKGQAYSWKKLGGLYKDNGEPQKSLDAFNKALALYKNIDDKEDYALLLEDFGSNYSNVKDYANALKYYGEALDVYRQIRDRAKIAGALYNISTVYYSDNKYEQAETRLDSAILIQTDIKDQPGLMRSHIYKGLISQFFQGNLRNALTFMHRALELAQITTSQGDIAWTQSSIGGLYQSSGMYDSAALYINRSLENYKKLEDKKNTSRLYMIRGFLQSEEANYAVARNDFNEALSVAIQSGNTGAKANALSGLSQVDLYSGNYANAFQLADSVLQLWQKVGNPWGIADAWLLLGNIRNRQNGFSDAIRYYSMSDSLYKILRIDRSRASAINNIGDIYFNQNDFDKALVYFYDALKILERTGDDRRFISLIKANIGESYIFQKKYTEAEKWMGESLALAMSIKNKTQMLSDNITLGRLKTLTKDIPAAGKYFEAAGKLGQETGDRMYVTYLESEWGRWYYLNNDDANAEKHLQRCIDISRQIGYRGQIWKAYSTLAEVRVRQNKTADAITQLENAIRVTEELKNSLAGGEEAKKIFSNDESVVDLYQRMAKYLKTVGRNDEALAFIEKSNIENINLRLKNDDAIGNAAAKEKKSEIYQYVKETTEELSKPEDQQNKEKIARLEKMTTIAEADYQQFITDLAKKYPGRNDLQKIDAKEFRKERKFIPPDVSVLSYLLTDHELSIFVVRRDTLLIKDIPVERQLIEKKIRQFYAASAHPPSADGSRRGADEKDVPQENIPIEQLSDELHALLIAPVQEAISGTKKIAVVPSGLLCFVPFQSLASKDASGKMQYFGDSKEVFYVNKITTVTNGRNEQMKLINILAAGNADNTLDNAATEVKSIQKIFPTATVYIGNDATKQKVLNTAGEFNVLHLATHGRLDYTNAENSYLVFAADKSTGDDGKLKINDIYRIRDLDRFKMVTLSACETAVVQDIAEGWPISTASAFLEAGVPTVIATLWKVDDKATSILVEKFYENMKTMDKVAALQNAQQFLRGKKEYSDPNYWAPFQLVGLWQ